MTRFDVFPSHYLREPKLWAKWMAPSDQRSNVPTGTTSYTLYTLHDHQSMHGLAWSGTRLLLSSLLSWGVERVKTRKAEVKTLDRYRTYRAYSVVRYLYTDLARLGPAHMKYRIYLQYEYDQNINKSPVRCLYSTEVLVDPRGFPGATLKVMSGTPIKLHRTCTRTAEARCPAYETQGKYTME